MASDDVHFRLYDYLYVSGFSVIIRNHKEDMALIQPTVVDEKDNGAVKEKCPLKTVCATYAICVYFIFWHLLCILYDCDLVT